MFHGVVTLHISWRRDFTVKTKVIAISPGLTTLNFGHKRRKINMVGLLLESEGAVMIPSNIFENTSSGIIFKRILIKPCKTSVPTLQILYRLTHYLPRVDASTTWLYLFENLPKIHLLIYCFHIWTT